MSRVAVKLSEWQTLGPETDSPLNGFGFGDDQAARDLAEELSDKNRLHILELARGLKIQATSFVGRVQLGALELTIQPKLPGAPMMHLLRYVYGLRDLHLFESSQHAIQDDTFQDLLVRQLAAEVSELLARGIHREYERRTADLAAPCGRIHFDRLAKQSHLARTSLPCIHHPRTDDHVLNQLVLSGLIHARKQTTDPDLKAHVGRLCQQLARDVSVSPLTAKLYSEALRRLDRRTRSYEPAMTIIEMLMQGKGSSLDEPASQPRFPGFLFDMNRFFQELLSKFLYEHLEEWEVVNELKMRGFFHYDAGRNPKNHSAPSQRPDFVIRKNRRVLAILDAKYRDLWNTKLPREMLYQLSLYALGVQAAERKAIILYPTLDRLAKDQAILIREPFGKASEAEVILRPVNLLLMDELLRDSSLKGKYKREEIAQAMAFGQVVESVN